MFNRLGRKKWNVHIRARYAHGEGVAAYLARYLKGGALKNTQLVSADASRVCFRYTPHRDEQEEDGDNESVLMTLCAEAFLERYLAHIAPPRLQSVRGYGLYGQRQGAALDQARAALGQTPVEEPEPLSVPRFLARLGQTPEAARCPRCGSLLVYASALPHGTGPPATLH
ncbi:MAG: transposase [Pseudomonadota bacterium]